MATPAQKLLLSLAVTPILPFTSPFTNSFDNLVDGSLKEWKVPGLSIAVIQGNETFAKGYGIANYPAEKVTPETIFYCASTTKAFTAAGVSLLVDRNPTISFDSPLSALIPDDFVVQDNYWTTHLTLQDALTHRTGLPGHMLAYDALGNASTPRDLVRNLRNVELSRGPRTEFQYCNLMYVVLCHVIETVSKSWLGDFFIEFIWTPLGMESTFFHIDDVLASKKPLARGYRFDPSTSSYVPVNWNPISGDGAGGIFSNVLDYAKWLRSMIAESGPLSKEGYEAVTTPQMLYSTGSKAGHGILTYGYGWNIAYYHGEKVLWHTGGLDGFNSYAVFLPERKWGAVLMTNTSPTGAVVNERLVYQLIDDLLDVPQEERVDWYTLSKQKADAAQHLWSHRKEILFPDTDHKPSALPLANYTGIFHHPGYHSLEISLVEGTLRVDADDRWLPFIMQFEHVSGEWFVVSFGTKGSYDMSPTKGRFILDERDKEVEAVEILLEDSLGGKMARFEKIVV